MFNETDKEQIEQLKKFWHEYGRLLVVAIAVGLACGYGWQYWKKYQHEQQLKAAVLFQAFNVDVRTQQQSKNLEELATSYKGSSYASFAKLTQAVSLIQEQHYDEALDILQWVRKNAPVKELRDLATIRAARLLLALNRAKESLDLLLELQDSVYQPMAYELEGDVYAVLGETKKATEAYQKADEAYAASGADNLIANRKANSPVMVPNKK